jgi:hypothetical protein
MDEFVRKEKNTVLKLEAKHKVVEQKTYRVNPALPSTRGATRSPSAEAPGPVFIR